MIGGQSLCNLRLAGDTDLIAGTESELQGLTTRSEKSARSYGMEMSSENSKILVHIYWQHEITNIMLNSKV